MDILLIGNGFDLAHGLPTTYKDFLSFTKVMQTEIEQPIVIDAEYETVKASVDDRIKKKIYDVATSDNNNRSLKKAEWIELLKRNFWLEYFYQERTFKLEGWIDFENEISKVIKDLDCRLNSLTDRQSLEEKLHLENSFINRFFSLFGGEIEAKTVRDRLLEDLNKLILALELYLSCYVQPKACEKRSPDIEYITQRFRENDDKAQNKVISFNYTNTFETLYGAGLHIDYDYIHGKVRVAHERPNNMVLGIDEYLPNDRKDTELEFIAFKKYYQRIFKETGSRYRLWVDEIKQNRESLRQEFDLKMQSEESTLEKRLGVSRVARYKTLDKEYTPKESNLYIFGHSLDVTDRDVLRDLILCDDINTTIFYHNRKQYSQQIINLVKMIGQAELIKRTGGKTKTITFREQQEMSPYPNIS